MHAAQQKSAGVAYAQKREGSAGGVVGQCLPALLAALRENGENQQVAAYRADVLFSSMRTGDPLVLALIEQAFCAPNALLATFNADSLSSLLAQLEEPPNGQFWNADVLSVLFDMCMDSHSGKAVPRNQVMIADTLLGDAEAAAARLVRFRPEDDTFTLPGQPDSEAVAVHAMPVAAQHFFTQQLLLFSAMCLDRNVSRRPLLSAAGAC